MSYNYTHVLSSLSPPPSPHPFPNKSSRLETSPVLLSPLPASLALQRESLAQSELELDRQNRQRQRERELAEALQEQEWEVQRAASRADVGSWRQGKTVDKGKVKISGPTTAFIRPPQAYELYQAIDKHDIDFIMRVRDHAFPLLLQKNAGEFPIVYAARIGDSHRDVVILLVGAFSRYVNHLEVQDFEKKETKNLLKALSDSWVHKAVYEISLLIRDVHSAPVKLAENMVRQFTTKELRGVVGGVSDVEEYIANAALDLVIMAVWSIASGQMGVDNLPTYTFARDTRTWKIFAEALAENRAGLGKVNRRVRGMMDKLSELGGDTRKSIQGRLKEVQAVLDEKG